MVKVMFSVLPVLALTDRLMSDLAFTGRVISDHVLTGPVMSNLTLTGRVMSDLVLTGRVISDLALNWPETDHNFDHDLDTRTYLNVTFSAHSIYEVKRDGSHLKNEFDMSLGRGHGQDLNQSMHPYIPKTLQIRQKH